MIKGDREGRAEGEVRIMISWVREGFVKEEVEVMEDW